MVMDPRDAKAFVDLLVTEANRRRALLPDDDGTGLAYDIWTSDLAFLHDLSLLYLVALRHHIERRLLFYAVCATGHGKPIKRATFVKRHRVLQKLHMGKRWNEIDRRLNPSHAAHYRSVEALRLLANSYKHDPRKQPAKELIKYLKLNQRLLYAELPESGELQKGLARLLDLTDKAGYADIVERFVEHSEEFLKDVAARNKLSSVHWGEISLVKFAH
jgi:hypothetical protein